MPFTVQLMFNMQQVGVVSFLWPQISNDVQYWQNIWTGASRDLTVLSAFVILYTITGLFWYSLILIFRSDFFFVVNMAKLMYIWFFFPAVLLETHSLVKLELRASWKRCGFERWSFCLFLCQELRVEFNSLSIYQSGSSWELEQPLVSSLTDDSAVYLPSFRICSFAFYCSLRPVNFCSDPFSPACLILLYV